MLSQTNFFSQMKWPWETMSSVCFNQCHKMTCYKTYKFHCFFYCGSSKKSFWIRVASYFNRESSYMPFSIVKKCQGLINRMKHSIATVACRQLTVFIDKFKKGLRLIFLWPLHAKENSWKIAISWAKAKIRHRVFENRPHAWRF